MCAINGFCTHRFLFGDFAVLRHLEQIVRGAFEYVAKRADDFVLNGFCFVIDHFVEILIAHAKLNIQPVFCLIVFFEQV